MIIRAFNFGSKVPLFDTMLGFLGIGETKFYLGRILIHDFSKPLGTKYLVLTLLCMGFNFLLEFILAGCASTVVDLFETFACKKSD